MWRKIIGSLFVGLWIFEMTGFTGLAWTVQAAALLTAGWWLLR